MPDEHIFFRINIRLKRLPEQNLPDFVGQFFDGILGIFIFRTEQIKRIKIMSTIFKQMIFAFMV